LHNETILTKRLRGGVDFKSPEIYTSAPPPNAEKFAILHIHMTTWELLHEILDEECQLFLTVSDSVFVLNYYGHYRNRIKMQV
jgi:hypothetical protein